MENNMIAVEVTTDTIITIAAVITALGVILGAVFTIYRWYLKQEKQDEDIRKMKKENTLICYGLRACLDGLEQLGANHTVPEAKDRLDKHLNKVAHDQE